MKIINVSLRDKKRIKYLLPLYLYILIDCLIMNYRPDVLR